ncbi:MAG TPA: hypothetical protein VMF29_03970 [Candidatus Edwardsbacteria bacterium]|nr:hypothetical protein [Candidatus Edwardsbacteria bacterium]
MKHTIIALACGIALLSCTKQQPPQQAVTPQPPRPVPVAEVNFVKGQVKAFSNGSWSAAAIGQQLLAVDSIEIPAKAELELKGLAAAPDAKGQFGGVLRIHGAAKGAVCQLTTGGPQVERPKPASKALATVKKLGTKQASATATPTAVAGIRGTQGRRPMIADTTKKDTTSHK